MLPMRALALAFALAPALALALVPVLVLVLVPMPRREINNLAEELRGRSEGDLPTPPSARRLLPLRRRLRLDWRLDVLVAVLVSCMYATVLAPAK